MNRRFKRLFSGVILAFMLCGGIGALAGTVQAQNRNPRRVIIVRRPIYRPYFYDPFWDPWRRHDRLDHFRYSRYVFSEPEKALNQGHKDGMKVGKGDAKNNRTYKPERSHYYHDAGFGNFGEVYRRGFTRGYAEGWRAQDLGR
jgi:hypothetical protein